MTTLSRVGRFETPMEWVNIYMFASGTVPSVHDQGAQFSTRSMVPGMRPPPTNPGAPSKNLKISEIRATEDARK